MTRIFTLLALVLALAQFVYAQNQPVWRTYKSEKDKFSAEFPAEPKVSEISDSKSTDAIGNFYKAYFDQTFYFVAACETEACPHLEIVKNLKLQAVNSPKSQFSEKTLENAVVENSFLDDDGFYHKIRQIKTKKTYFLIHSVSDHQTSENADRFFSSFKLGAGSPDSLKFVKERFERPLAGDKFKIPLPPATFRNQSDDPANKITPNNKKPVTVPIQIYEKPKALYTDAARIYEISGEVFVRAIFMANGNIRAVTPIKKLPFGLTAQAVLAAEGIKFQPATRDGVPYSVTKPIVYQFTIY